jgi:hypothetical protein
MLTGVVFFDRVKYSTYNSIMMMVIVTIVIIEIWTEVLVRWSLEIHLLLLQISVGGMR